ncbi:hypothetical protein RB597_006136 [Gaeumannomyces tritici]
MASIQAPPGPPPARPPSPSVPDGWKACWAQESQKWYYYELATGNTQWDLPGSAPPPPPPPAPQAAEAPPSYAELTPASTAAAPTGDVKRSPFEDATASPNPGGASSSSAPPPPTPDSTKPRGDVKAPLLEAPTPTGNSTFDTDAKMAAEMQAEENARARAVASPPQPSFPNQQQLARAAPEKPKRSVIDKLLDKIMPFKSRPQQSHNVSHNPGYPGSGQQYGSPVSPQQAAIIPYPTQSQYNGVPHQAQQYPQQYYGQNQYQYGYNHQQQLHPQSYGGYPYPQQQAPAGRRPGGAGMGMMGGAALGLGVGTMGAVALGGAMSHSGHNSYQEGYQDGAGDFGGGGDFGGDF